MSDHDLQGSNRPPLTDEHMAEIAKLKAQAPHLTPGQLMARVQALHSQPATVAGSASNSTVALAGGSSAAAVAAAAAAATAASRHLPKVVPLSCASHNTHSQQVSSMELPEQESSQPYVANAPVAADAMTTRAPQQETTLGQHVFNQAGSLDAWHHHQQQPWDAGSYAWQQEQHVAQQFGTHQPWLHGQYPVAGDAYVGGLEGDSGGDGWPVSGAMEGIDGWHEGEGQQEAEGSQVNAYNPACLGYGKCVAHLLVMLCHLLAAAKANSNQLHLIVKVSQQFTYCFCTTLEARITSDNGHTRHVIVNEL